MTQFFLQSIRLLGIAATATSLALAAAAARAAPTGGDHADASLTIEGRSIRLDHVVAVHSGNEEGLDDGPRLLVFLCDVAPPSEALIGATTGRAQAWARLAKASLVVLRADADGKGTAGSAAVLSVPGLAPDRFVSMTSSDGFSSLRMDAKRVAGSAAFGSGDASVKATFDAAIVRPAVQDLKGDAARQAAPTRTWLSFRDALRRGDLPAASAYATRERMAQIEQLKARVGEQFLSMLKQGADPAALSKSVTRVVVRGSVASIVLSTKEVNEVVRDGDAWKVD